MASVKQVLLIGSAVFCLLFLNACATTRKQSEEFNTYFASSAYDQAAMCLCGQELVDAPEAPKDKLIPLLNSASCYFLIGNTDTSLRAFHKADEVIQIHDAESMAADVAGTIAALLVNDEVRSYKGESYDGIMVNTYKALEFLALKNWDEARIELNRADERQRLAAEKAQKEIEKTQKAIEEKQKEESLFDLSKTFESKEANTANEQLMAELNGWALYPDFVNPFTTYLHGISFMLFSQNDSDLAKAVESLERVHSMTGSSVAKADFEMAENLANGNLKRDECEDRVWVIFENGMCPEKVEMRLDIPLFTENIMYVGIAYPMLVHREAAYQNLNIYNNGTLLGSTQLIADMDGVIAAEFRADLPGIWARTIASAAFKTILQKQAGDKFGVVGQLAGSAYQYASNRADLRMWSALPKNFQACSFVRPQDGIIDIIPPDNSGSILSLEIPTGKFSILYIKMPTSSSTPAYKIIQG